MESQGTPTPSAPNLAQASATPPAGYASVQVAVPPRGESTTVAVVPGTEYQLDAADVNFVKEGNNLVAESDDGGKVVFEDYFTFASSELPPAVALADGGVVPQEQILAELGNPDLNAAEPAAGPAAGAGAGGPLGGGALFDPYSPGDIGTGLSTLDLLGNLDLAFAPPEPTEDPGVLDLAEGSVGIEILTGYNGEVVGAIFEDNRPNANSGDLAQAFPTLNILFTPADDEVVTETRITGFPVGIQLTLTDGTIIDVTDTGLDITAGGVTTSIDDPARTVTLSGGLQTGILITGLPENADADFTLNVSLDIQDSTTGTQTATLSASSTVTVDAVADLAVIETPSDQEIPEDNAEESGGSGTFVDNTPRFDIGFSTAAADTDRSEEITQVVVTISGLLAKTIDSGANVAWANSEIPVTLWSPTGSEQQISVITVSGSIVGSTASEILLQVTATLGADGDIVLTMVPVVSDGTGGFTPLSDDAFDLIQVESLDLSALQVILPQHSDDSFTVNVAVRTEETNPTDSEFTLDNNVAVNETQFDVTVRAVADAAAIIVVDKSYDEDTAETGLVSVENGVATYYAGFTAAVTDTDGSESLTQVRVTFADDNATRDPAETLSIGGREIGATETTVTVAVQYVDTSGNLATGTASATATFVGGVLTLTFADAARVQQVYLDGEHGTPLTLGVPEHSDDDYTVTVEVTSTETNPIDDTPLHPSTTVSEEFHLEIQAVADTPTISWTSGAGEALQVSYVGTHASFHNLLGVYIIGADGLPADAQLIFADTGSTDPGEILASLPAGAEYRFFLVEKGATTYGSDLDTLNDGLELARTGDGKLVLSIDGKEVTHVYYSDTTHNFDSSDHVVVGYNDDGSLTIGFEDMSNGGDHDFDDVVVNVSGGTQNFEDYNNTVDAGVAFKVGFVASTPDQDGSEHLSNIVVTISGLADADATSISFGEAPIGDTIIVNGVPVDVVKTVDAATGTITLTLTPNADVHTLDLSGLRVGLPEHSDDDFRVDVSVTTTEFDPEGTVAVSSATSTSGFNVIVDAVADRPTIDTEASETTVGEERTVTLSASAAFTDVADGSESHYLLVQVPTGADGTFSTDGMVVTGADGGAYQIVTISGGVVSGTALPDGFDYSSLADGTYVVAQVHEQLAADHDTAKLTVTLTAPVLDVPGTVSQSYTAETYAISIETKPTDGELDHDNNIAIAEGSTWTVTVTDDVPSATNRSVTIAEDGLTKTANTETGNTGVLFAFDHDVQGASAAFTALDQIKVTGLPDGTKVDWAYDGNDIVGTVAGDSAPSIRLSLTGEGNAIRVHTELLQAFDNTGTRVQISHVTVTGTDQDGDTADALVTVNVTDDVPTVSATLADAGSANVAKALEGDTIGGTLTLDIGADGGTLSVSVDGKTPIQLTLQPDGTYAGSDPELGKFVVTLGDADPATAQRTGTWSLTTPNVAATAAHSLIFTATDGDLDTANSTTLHYVVADHLPKVEGVDKSIGIGLTEGDATAHSDSVVIDFGTDVIGSRVSFHTQAEGAITGADNSVQGITIAGVSEDITWKSSSNGTTLTGYVGNTAVIELNLKTSTNGDETQASVTARILNGQVFDNLVGGHSTGALTISGLSLIAKDGGNAADTDSVLVPVSVSVADAVPHVSAAVDAGSNVVSTGESAALVWNKLSGTIAVDGGADGLDTVSRCIFGSAETLSATITGSDGSTYTYALVESLLFPGVFTGSPTSDSDDLGIMTIDTRTGKWSVNVKGIEASYTKSYDITFQATDHDGDVDTATVHGMVVDISRLDAGGGAGGTSGLLTVTVDDAIDGFMGNVGVTDETQVASGTVDSTRDLSAAIRVATPSGNGTYVQFTDQDHDGTYTATVGGETLRLTFNGNTWSLTTSNISGESVAYDLQFNAKTGILGIPISGVAHVVVVDSVPVASEDALAISVGETDTGAASASGSLVVDFGYDKTDGTAEATVKFADTSGISVSGMSGVTWTVADGGATLIGWQGLNEVIKLAITTAPGAQSDQVAATVTATLRDGHLLNDTGSSGVNVSGVTLVGTDTDGDTVTVPVSVHIADGVPTISATGSDFTFATEQIEIEAVTGSVDIHAGPDGLDTLVATIKDTAGKVVESIALAPDGSGGYSGTGAAGSVVTVSSDGAWSLTPGNIDGGYAEYSIAFTVTDGDGDSATSDSFNYVVVDGRPEITAVGTNASGMIADPAADGFQHVSGTITLTSVDPVDVIKAKVGNSEITLNKTESGMYEGTLGSTTMRLNLTQSGAVWSGTWVMDVAALAALTSYTVAFQAVEAAAGSDPLGGDGDAGNWTVAVTDTAPTLTVSDPSSVTLTDDGDLVISGSINQHGGNHLDADGASVSGSTWSYTLDADAGEDHTDLTFVRSDADGDVAKATAHFVAVTMAEHESGDMIGTDGNDILVGSEESNTIEGGDGHDILFGRGGDDVLVGGAGNDLLIGGAGNDVLKGGDGEDTFQFNSVSDGHDTIVDFHLDGSDGTGGDTIDLDALFDALAANGAPIPDSEAGRDALVDVTAGTGADAGKFVVSVAGHETDFSVTVMVDNAPSGASHDEIAQQIKAQVDTHGS